METTPSFEDDALSNVYVQSHLRRLPIQERSVVLLSMEGLRPGEIARVLGIAHQRVSERMSRAEERIRQMALDKWRY